MKLLVTGGAGYVGAAVARMLLDAGRQAIDQAETDRDTRPPCPRRVRTHSSAHTRRRGSCQTSADRTTPGTHTSAAGRTAMRVSATEVTLAFGSWSPI